MNKDEKQKGSNNSAGEDSSNLMVFITGLGMQALVFLGDVPNPLTNKKEADLKNAKYMIDTIAMLKEKTNGNISSEEEKIFGDLLYELRLKYLELVKKEGT